LLDTVVGSVLAMVALLGSAWRSTPPRRWSGWRAARSGRHGGSLRDL